MQVLSSYDDDLRYIKERSPKNNWPIRQKMHKTLDGAHTGSVCIEIETLSVTTQD
jgi:hypothetical protein